MIFRPQIKKQQGRVIVLLDMIIGIDTPALPVPALLPCLMEGVYNRNDSGYMSDLVPQ
jgi:hypothetical protein